MVCKNCGKTIADGLQFCTECGAAVNEVVSTQQVVNAQKSRVVAGLLGIFLGGLGIHNFYLGFTSKAIINIILSIFCGIGAIWGLIEGIMILMGKVPVDANNIPLKD